MFRIRTNVYHASKLITILLFNYYVIVFVILAIYIRAFEEKWAVGHLTLQKILFIYLFIFCFGSSTIIFPVRVEVTVSFISNLPFVEYRRSFHCSVSSSCHVERFKMDELGNHFGAVESALNTWVTAISATK